MGLVRASAARLRSLLSAVLVAVCLLACLTPSEVRAERCVAYGSVDEALGDLARDPARWRCGEIGGDLRPERTVVRFDLSDHSKPPEYLSIRRSALGAVTVAALDGAGNVSPLRTATLADFEADGIDGRVRLALPQLDEAPGAVLVAIDHPTTPMLAKMARLENADARSTIQHQRDYALVALVAGMIILPLLFNFAFWRVLRERFLIAHMLFALAMLITVTASSNLLNVLAGVSIESVSILATFGFGLTVCAGALFAAYFIEPGKLHPVLRKALVPVAIAALTLATVHALAPFWLRPIQIKLYMLGFLPILLILVAVMLDALRRGSRAVLFQLVGWGPLIGVGIVRQVSYLVPGIPETDAMALFYIGCAFEVIATALGVADRLMIVRRERDRAVAESQVLEDLAERDPLTGLLNRRAVEPQFETLRAQGFTVCGLVDLDHFKSVNDSFGHTVGDDVLYAVALALQPDDDTLAMRMGGEEFMLLLRGENARERAEARRRAITQRVAAEVSGLDRPVTASMGLVEMPREVGEGLAFAALYSRADTLLYEAKQAGRNRTMAEKVTVFNRRRGDRRTARAA